MTKKASAYLLIYGLYFLLICGIIFVAFNQVQTNYIRPLVNSTAINGTATDIAEANRFMGFWSVIPYMLLLVVSLYFIIHIGIFGGG
jgi:hypothetical protein